MIKSSIRTYFTVLLLPTVILFSFGVTVLLSVNDYKVSKSSRLESEALILETFVSAVRQPLLQGSYIEAQIRANSLMKNNQVACVQVWANQEIVVNCEKSRMTDKEYHRVEMPIFYGDDNKDKFGSVVINFDNSDLVSRSWQRVTQFAVAFAVLGILLYIVLSFGLSRVIRELRSLVEEGQAEGKTAHKSEYRIKELEKLSGDIKGLMNQAATVAQAKASLEVAQQVAHDIRSPISSMKMLISDLKAVVSDQHHVALRRNAERISDIANDLIEKHKNGTLKRLEPLAPESLIRDIIQEKKVQYSNLQGISIETDIADDGLGDVVVSTSDFKRVISNLIDNSVEAIEGTGEIKVSLRFIGSQALFVVCDNGKGIPPEHFSKLFERGSTFGKSNGKGLGLYHAKKVIGNFRGRIEIKSEQGIGTEVTIVLPVQPNKYNQRTKLKIASSNV